MYHHFGASHASFPTQGTSQTSKAPQPSRTARAQSMLRTSMPSTQTFVPESATQNHPKTSPLRVGTTLSANTFPNIDAIRALYRKYPHRFPKRSPHVGLTPPNAPGRPVPPRYRDSVFDTIPGNPTPAGPRSRPRTTSHSRTGFRRNQIATSSTMNSRFNRPSGAAVDEPELTLMYPDFGPGFIPADDPVPNLALDIILTPHDREKWELPQRDIYESWKCSWKLQLVISYTSTSAAGRVDLDFEPSIGINNVTVNCSLAAKPRLISGTTISARRPSESYEVTYRGFSTTCASGILEPMPVDCGIRMECNWHGPNLASVSNIGTSERRVEYRANIYIPIPFFLFSAANTRAFDIDARAWVSVANRPAVQLKRMERITLSQFGQVSAYDDSVVCILAGNR